MPSLYTEIEIHAPRAAVWRALIAKENWLKWNTFLFDRNPSLPFKQGQTVQLSLKRSREETETEFEPRILVFQPGICLHWRCSAPGFHSEHVFELQDLGRTRTKYVHRESFSGTFTVLLMSLLRRDEQQGMRRMARELKRYVEE